MPIHSPGRRAGSGAALRSAKKHMSGKHGRSIYASLNLTSMVDFMTVVVIFLLMQFSTSGELSFLQKDITLPTSTSTNQLDAVPVVGISATSIIFEGKLVTNIESMLNPDGPIIVELQPLLDQRRNQWAMTRPGVPFDHKVIVNADQNIDFRMIKKIMTTCTIGQFNNIMFATRTASRIVAPGAAPAAAGE